MPRAEIASKQAIFTLTQLHAELAGKFAENRNAGVKIKTAMMRNGGTVTGIGAPARWVLNTGACWS